MLSKPENGWTYFTLDNFSSRASYLTNIPQNCIDAFVYGLKNNRPITIEFDAEGWEFNLICNAFDSYVVTYRGETEVYYIQKGLREIIQEFLNDFERDYEAWQLWEHPCEVKKNYDLSELIGLLIE